MDARPLPGFQFLLQLQGIYRKDRRLVCASVGSPGWDSDRRWDPGAQVAEPCFFGVLSLKPEPSQESSEPQRPGVSPTGIGSSRQGTRICCGSLLCGARGHKHLRALSPGGVARRAGYCDRLLLTRQESRHIGRLVSMARAVSHPSYPLLPPGLRSEACHDVSRSHAAPLDAAT